MLTERKAEPEFTAKHFKTPIHQVKTHVSGHGSGTLFLLTRPGAPDREFRHIGLSPPALLRKPFYNVAITITGRKRHSRIITRRILPQNLFHNAECLYKIMPVGRLQEAKTADRIRDRNLVGRLFLAGRPDNPVEGLALFGELSLKPGERKIERLVLTMQPPRKFGDKSFGKRQIPFGHRRDFTDHAVRIFGRHFKNASRPVFGLVSFLLRDDHPGRNTPKIFNECEPQHDGDRPQLPHFQRTDRLIGIHKLHEPADIQTAVPVRYQLHGDLIHTRTTGKRPPGKVREFTDVTFGKVFSGKSYLFFNEIKIIQDPFPGRGNFSF
ncbi:MAG: hypothetical protein BWY42_01561 [Candidatus Omnitrophica bacterium ADurb.Bin277]|nr:MAG: hypothetical protein BWY42_01561 [Candidatus Omnitrophica bacterium ADurb.Bin277]